MANPVDLQAAQARVAAAETAQKIAISNVNSARTYNDLSVFQEILTGATAELESAMKALLSAQAVANAVLGGAYGAYALSDLNTNLDNASNSFSSNSDRYRPLPSNQESSFPNNPYSAASPMNPTQGNRNNYSSSSSSTPNFQSSNKNSSVKPMNPSQGSSHVKPMHPTQGSSNMNSSAKPMNPNQGSSHVKPMHPTYESSFPPADEIEAYTKKICDPLDNYADSICNPNTTSNLHSSGKPPVNSSSQDPTMSKKFKPRHTNLDDLHVDIGYQ